MDSYTRLIKSISLGEEHAPTSPMTPAENELLLALVVERTKAFPVKNGYETAEYYIYIGEFPALHVAVDNKSGTTRLFTLYNYYDFLAQKNKMTLYQ